jgi:hypothetical protein
MPSTELKGHDPIVALHKRIARPIGEHVLVRFQWEAASGGLP